MTLTAEELDRIEKQAHFALHEVERMRQRGGKRTIIRKLIINEISAVDRPAHESALAVLIKRREATDAEVIAEYRKQFPDPPVSNAQRDAALAPVLAAIRKREEREAKEATKMDANDTNTIRKAALDASRDMEAFIANRGRNISKVQAQEQWRKLHPEEFAKLQASPPRSPAPLAKAGEHQTFFKLLVDEIQKRDHCSRTVAMEIARRENSAAFERMQTA